MGESGRGLDLAGRLSFMASAVRRQSAVGVFIVVVVATLAVARAYNVLLFHTLVEIVATTVLFSVFALAWISREQLYNGYLTVIGAASGMIGILNLLHGLAFPGAQFFPGTGGNATVLLWLLTRYIELAAFLIAPLMTRVRVDFFLAACLFALAGLVGCLGIGFGWFPPGYIDGVGQTAFKTDSEYVFIGMEILAIGLLWRVRKSFSADTFGCLLASLLLSVSTELCFSVWVKFDDATFEVGHYFRFIAVVFCYFAVVVTGVKRPSELMLRRLVDKEKQLESVISRLVVSEDRLKRAQSIAVMGSWHNDMIDHKLTWSDETYNIYEFPVGKAVTFPDEVGRVHLDDRAKFLAKWHEALTWETAKNGARFDIDYRIVIDGRIKWLRARADVKFSPDGIPLEAIGVTQDITERAQIDDMLRFLARTRFTEEGFLSILLRYLGKNLEIGRIVVWDKQGDTGWAEIAACHVRDAYWNFGPYPLEIGAFGTALDLVCHPSGAWRQLGTDPWAMELGIEGYLSILLKDSDGAVLGLLEAMDGRPFGDRSEHIGTMFRIVATAVESELERRRKWSEKTRQEEERVRLIRQVHEARKLESIGRLAGGIAHDFNNILGAIIGFTKFIGEDLPPGDGIHKHVERILSCGTRGRKLVEQIMTFARRKESNRSRFTLSEVVDHSLPIIEVALPSSIRIAVDIRSDKVWIEADREQMEQVLLNLCINARDAMENALGTIIIGVERLDPNHPLLVRAGATSREGAAGPDIWTEPDGAACAVVGRCEAGRAYASLTVQDNGTGMDEFLISKIFDPFFTTKEIGKGTGFGLSVVHGVMLDHNGLIAVRSRVGKGTEFRVVVPLTQSNENSLSTSLDSAPVACGETGRLLLVDDDIDFGEMLRTELERRGWDVVLRSNPGAALAEFAADPGSWKLMVTDQVMPDLTGQDLIRKVREVRKDFPCILCSGYNPDEVGFKNFHPKSTAALYKPFSPEELVSAIARVVGSSHA